MTDYTKNLKVKARLLNIISITLTVLPIFIFVMRAFFSGDVSATKKLAMGMLVIMAIILTAINVLFKYSIRSTIWILLLGVYICLENIIPLLITIAVCTILDEFVITPLHKKYSGEYKINKEIDKRNE